MKIAYVIYQGVITSSKSNGIRSQALTWASLLRSKGHTVNLISDWEVYDWVSYDAIHFFGSQNWLPILLRLSTINNNWYYSPITDPLPGTNYKVEQIKRLLVTKTPLGKCFKTKITDEHILRLVKKICVRTEFEKKHLSQLFNLDENHFELIPLSFSEFCNPIMDMTKEPFCLHISSIYQERKNVIRLIEAAKKYNFKLVLAGSKGSPSQFEVIKRAIGDANNISVLGFISQNEMIELYKRAKVFALPSIQEGVGIVSLDAAFYGCEVVITNIPGPKEYYKGKCLEVNPFNVDEIGIAVRSLLDNKISYQPQLSHFIQENYSPQVLCAHLEEMYSRS